MRMCVIISLAFLLITTLCACPYNSAYQLDDEPQQNIDESLLGKWATHGLQGSLMIRYRKKSP
jgi:hypothetical protein